MSANTIRTHAHVEPTRAERGQLARPADNTPVVANNSATAPSQAPKVNAAGMPIKPQASPIIAREDRNAQVAFTAIAGIGQLRPGEVECLAGHGINVGMHKGILSIIRAYVPAATNLLQQFRGGRS